MGYKQGPRKQRKYGLFQLSRGYLISIKFFKDFCFVFPRKLQREAFQSEKQRNLGISPKRGWDFFELGTFLKWVDPPTKINLGLF